ncbi:MULTISPECIES: NADH:flavin oxidoreductase [unclassified Sphingomonas]|uniref:NADH:flavin oxidoreductase n=1 Tax=unclassified Sphingomonas TaxID=196159 RepID=UPI001F277601|nr:MULTISPECIES: NADH:flavin oxidoreductase [unclassified Sphingomonas]
MNATVSLTDRVDFRRGPAMANRLALAPLTNLQSNDDGTISEDEHRWLVKRAAGGFGMVMTCAATTHPLGKGFPRQLGVHDDIHLPGLERLARDLRAAGAVSSVQLQHSGMRAAGDLIGEAPVGVVDDPARGVRGLSTGEVEQAIEDFIEAGLRAERAGFDGVEVHGAHGYLLCQFLDVRRNQRSDRYGGSPENRARALLDVIAGLRDRARPDFQIGVRLSPERYGVDLGETRALAARLMREGRVDSIDISCWDTFKKPEDPAFQDRVLMDWFTDLDRHGVRLGVAGKLTAGANARRCIDHGADFVLIGRGAILHHDFARRVGEDADFLSAPFPVTRAHLAREGLGGHFIDYMATWDGFVVEEQEDA